MAKVLFGLLSFLFIISFGIVVAGNPFTIYLDGGSEFQSLGDHLVKLKSDEKDVAEYAQRRFADIEAKVDKLTNLVGGLVNDLKAMKSDMSNSKRSCVLKLGGERNYKL